MKFDFFMSLLLHHNEVHRMHQTCIFKSPPPTKSRNLCRATWSHLPQWKRILGRNSHIHVHMVRYPTESNNRQRNNGEEVSNQAIP